MNPTTFNGANVIFAEDQPQYLQLPAYKDNDGMVITEWEFSEEERKRIYKGENLRLSTQTFNQPLQPLRPYLASLLDEYEEEDKGKKENAFSDRKCGDEPKPEQPITYTPGELITCECGKRAPVEFSHLDEDGTWSCPSCIQDYMYSEITKLRGKLKKNDEGFPSEIIKENTEPSEKVECDQSCHLHQYHLQHGMRCCKLWNPDNITGQE